MVLKLLVAMLLHPALCHAGLRARDPDVEEEMHVLRDSEPGTFGTAHLPVPHGHQHGHQHGHGHHSTAGPLQKAQSIPQRSPLTPMRDSSQPPTRTGNWCAVVHRRVVTMAVLCGTETYTQKTVNPCAKGDPDCQIYKYQLSSRPVYRQKQRIFTALHWKCCPGHGGHNCEDTEEEIQSSKEHTENTQNDNHSGEDDSGGEETDLLEDGSWDNGPVQSPPSVPVFPVPGNVGSGGTIPPTGSLPFMDSVTLLTVHKVFAAVMTHLQPVLDGFNHTLEHLSSEVKDLSMDLQKLKHEKKDHSFTNRQTRTGTIEEKLEDNSLQIRQIQSQLNLQQKQVEETVEFQQQQLQNNLMSLEDDIDLRMNRSHEALQVSLQSLRQSVEEIRRGQQNLEEEMEAEYAPSARVSEGPPAPVSGMWEAISRLDQKVLNNTAQLSALSENSTHLMNAAQKLDHCLQNLSTRLDGVSRSSEIHFAETGLELEATKVAAFKSINELAANLSSQERHLRELELYLDSIYQQVQTRNDQTTSTVAEGCSCQEIQESLISLELKVTNVTELAKENQYALEDAEAKQNQGLSSHWAMQVEDLHQALLSVKESLAFEQAKSRTLNEDLSQLKGSLLGSQREILELNESFRVKAAEIKHLSASFSSLLKDAIRHSEVLEILLGDEVMEFSSWSNNQQKELSIPVLLQRLKLMQDKIETHEISLDSLRTKQKRPEKDHHQMTGDDPVAFSDWGLIDNQGRNVEDHHEDHYVPLSPALEEDNDDDGGDYSVSDFWSLGREVEELANRILQIEQKPCNCTAAPGGSVVELQAEVDSLRQDLGDHLRIFQNLFSHTEELARASHSLNLEQLWTMLSRKDRKKKKGQIVKEKGVESSGIRKKRSIGKGSPFSQLAFVTSLQDRTNGKDMILVSEKVSLNHGNAYRPSLREFQAPQAGFYLFLVTLDFETGPGLAQLRRGMVPVVSFRRAKGTEGPLSQASLLKLQKGDKITLELVKGKLRQGHPNDDNTLSGVLLFRTEDLDMRTGSELLL